MKSSLLNTIKFKKKVLLIPLRTKRKLIQVYKIFSLIILFHDSNSLIGQYEYLQPYIPYDSCDFNSHPIIEIKLWIHIVQKDKKNPENLTSDSLNFIHQQYRWINNFYKNIKTPTLKIKNQLHYVKDSRIRFLVDTVTFHINENGWDRIKYIKEKNPKRWMKILATNPDSGTIEIEGVRDRFALIQDSIIIENSQVNKGVYNVANLYTKKGNTILSLINGSLLKKDTSGYLSYYKKIDKNCHNDNWINFTNENKDFLHVFYTGSSVSVPAFGCGPSPFFLNISSILENGAFATAQLTAHEIGHCLGLRHTNTPQFSDLPLTDQFGWLKCNNSTVSNNIMGYNKCRNYLSPLQIAYVHYRYSSNNDLYNTLTNKENKEITIIAKPTVWEKNVMGKKRILIKKNQSLTVKKHLIIPNNGIIILEKNSQLIIDNGKVYSPNENWKGIRTKRSILIFFKKLFSLNNEDQIFLKDDGVVIY